MWINSAIPIAQQKSKYNNVALTSSSISFLHITIMIVIRKDKLHEGIIDKRNLPCIIM
jgi:hypothetical protein